MPANRRKTVAKKLTPREATTFAKIDKLARDNIDTPEFWVLLGGKGNPKQITITKQRVGQPAQAMLTLSRHDFERIIDWYNTGIWRAR